MIIPVFVWEEDKNQLEENTCLAFVFYDDEAFAVELDKEDEE